MLVNQRAGQVRSNKPLGSVAEGTGAGTETRPYRGDKGKRCPDKTLLCGNWHCQGLALLSEDNGQDLCSIDGAGVARDLMHPAFGLKEHLAGGIGHRLSVADLHDH